MRASIVPLKKRFDFKLSVFQADSTRRRETETLILYHKLSCAILKST